MFYIPVFPETERLTGDHFSEFPLTYELICTFTY